MSSDLTEQQVNDAFSDLYVKYPRTERLPVDPPIAGQNYGLFSFKFLPTPVKGVYGFLKFRGAFPEEHSMERHAKNIIRSVDSSHKLWPYEQGRWMPITVSEDFAKDVLDVTQQDDLKQIYNNGETQEMKENKRKVMEVKERQKKLMSEANNKELDKSTLEYYAQQIMRKEQTLSWLEGIRNQKRKIIKALQMCNENIAEIEKEHPEYIDQVEEEIKKIKEDVGLDPESDISKGFITPEQ